MTRVLAFARLAGGSYRKRSAAMPRAISFIALLLAVTTTCTLAARIQKKKTGNDDMGKQTIDVDNMQEMNVSVTQGTDYESSANATSSATLASRLQERSLLQEGSERTVSDTLDTVASGKGSRRRRDRRRAPTRRRRDRRRAPVPTSRRRSRRRALVTTQTSSKVPFMCASGEGRTCACDGEVFYGRKHVSGTPGSGRTTSFDQLKQSTFRKKTVSGSISCSSGSFGGDPLPGVFKHCFCAPAGSGASGFKGPQDVMTCSSGAIQKTTCLTTRKYRDIVSRIDRIVDQLAVHGCNKNSCPQASWTGCVLRMAGHDFMDFIDNEGGSDACTDLDFGDNKGLLPCLANGEFGHSLHDVYAPFCSEVSLADFIVIAGEAVMMKTRKIAQRANSSRSSLDFTVGPHEFKFGRQSRPDCGAFEQKPVRTTVGGSTRTSPRSHLLTNPEDACDGVQTTFVNQMGLGDSGGMKNALSAALMGVHTLGRARKENTGYDGWWSEVGKQKEFTNDYYVSMIAKGWGPKNMAPNKNQWKRIDGPGESTNEMMLDSDLCLAYKNEHRDNFVKAGRDNCCAWVEPAPHPFCNGRRCLPASIRHLSCSRRPSVKGSRGQLVSPSFVAFGARGSCCGPVRADCGSPINIDGFAADAVIKYATDEAAWLADFKKAWSIATTNGHSNLRNLDRC